MVESSKFQELHRGLVVLMRDNRSKTERFPHPGDEEVARCSPAVIAKRQADRILERVGHSARKIAFIEAKKPDLEYVAALLSHCERCNHWANRGPLYWALAESYEKHMNVPSGLSVTPCANGGIALEALARFHDARFGGPQRWVGSAFSFKNLGRGWFDSMRFLDCDDQGMLDLSALQAMDPTDYDGFVVTNIFGLWRDFAPYIAFAKQSGKHMLIDNAAGIDERVPDWPYQTFSLHHTKPYGVGEGGLILSPRNEADAIYQLLNYGENDEATQHQWLNNGKLSDIACAFHLDRLARFHHWAPRYREQAARVREIGAEVGLKPLVPAPRGVPATSEPFLSHDAVPLDQLQKSRRLHFGKYYNPLMEMPKVASIYSNLVNVPTHPDVAQLSDSVLKHELETFVVGLESCKKIT